VTLRTRRGFGSAIILEAAQQFGNVSMIYRPEGLVYQLQVDLKEIKPSSVTLGERRVRSGAREALGRTDLVPHLIARTLALRLLRSGNAQLSCPLLVVQGARLMP
jgi:hypothetical protein